MNTNTIELKDKIINLLKSRELTVEAVRQLGFKTYITHNRNRQIDAVGIFGYVEEPLFQIDKSDRQFNLIAYGGCTEVEVVDEKTGIQAKAIAICSPRDTYEKRIGIAYGLRRAFRDILGQIRNLECKDEKPYTE